MNLSERTKGKYVPSRRIPPIQKFEMDDHPIDSSGRRKNRLRHEIPDYADRMEKHYSTTMADQIPSAYTPADVYKPRKHHVVTNKSANMYSQAMSNDDLYRMIHINSSGTRPKVSVDNLVPRRDSRRQKIVQSPLSLIADEDEDEEVSEPEYGCETRTKPFEDDEADDEIDYESDQYGVDPVDQLKNRRFSQKSIESDPLKQQYNEWLAQRRFQTSRGIDKSRNGKYERMNRGKSSLKQVEEPPEQQKHVVGMHRCSECGKTLESLMKPAGSRGGRVLYDFPEYQRDVSGSKSSKFQDPLEDMVPCPKPRKSKNMSRQRESKKTIGHLPSKIDAYYDE